MPTMVVLRNESVPAFQEENLKIFQAQKAFLLEKLAPLTDKITMMETEVLGLPTTINITISTKKL